MFCGGPVYISNLRHPHIGVSAPFWWATLPWSHGENKEKDLWAGHQGQSAHQEPLLETSLDPLGVGSGALWGSWLTWCPKGQKWEPAGPSCQRAFQGQCFQQQPRHGPVCVWVPRPLHMVMLVQTLGGGLENPQGGIPRAGWVVPVAGGLGQAPACLGFKDSTEEWHEAEQYCSELNSNTSQTS